MKKAHYLILLIVIVLVIDQWTKLWVKHNMYLGEEFPVFGHWFFIHYMENNGMAFGMELISKQFLSIFRIFAVLGIGYGIYYLLKHKYPIGLLIAVSLIFAGALGNIIDSIFYGYIYGYAPLLHGRVVDMLYFPLIESTFPDWIPFVGGEDFIFFRPIFNIADTAISVGVGMILLFQNRYFESLEE